MDLWNRPDLESITKQIDNSTIGFHYQPDDQHILNLGYSYVFNEDYQSGAITPKSFDNLKITDISFAWPVTHTVSAVGRWSQDWNANHFQNQLYGLQYDSCCWAIRLIGGRTFSNLSSTTAPLNITVKPMFNCPERAGRHRSRQQRIVKQRHRLQHTTWVGRYFYEKNDMHFFALMQCNLLCGKLAKAAEQSLDQIVAVVNDDVITDSELNHALATTKAQLSQEQLAMPPATVLHKQVLDQLINKRLQLQIAQKSGVQISDVNSTVQSSASRSKIICLLKCCIERINGEGMTTEDYRHEMRDQLTMQKLQQQKSQAKSPFRKKNNRL